MNQKFKRNVFFLFLFLFFGIGNAQITIASDNAGNYGSWTDGSNGGTGFGPWTIYTGANTGVFIGNPSSNEMGTSGIGTTAFGLWATGNQYVNATRDLLYPMQIGDEFSFYWATNWDPNGGSKGIDLRDSSNNNIITLLHSGTFSANNIVASGSLTATISTNYGVEPMLVTITRTSGTQYTINITRRKTSDGTYTSTFNSLVAISRINLFNGNTNQADGKRNTYFNNFIQKRPNTPTIITSGSISAFSNTCVGASSAQQSYTVSGANLTANLEITAPTHFQISTTSGSGFGSSLSLSPSSGTVSSTTIYVRFSPSASGAQSGNITHTSTGATTQNIAVSGTANAIPSAPTASATQVFCGSATVANLTATGTSIQWYSASTGGTPLSSSTVLVNGNKYYASQTVSGCESPRTEVTVTINALPSAPSATGTTICSGSTATISATSGAGETIDWYASATGGTALLSGSTSYTSPSLTTTTTYYAEARNTTTGCKSATRTAVTVTVRSIGYATTHTPTSTTTCSPGAITVRGEVYAQFITDTLNSQGAPMVAEFGYGTSTDPNTWANWSTATYIGNGIKNNNNDLYEGSISGITTNTYYYGFRFRISSGCTYYYAGIEGSYPSENMRSIVINSPPTTSNAGSNQTVCGAATLAANTPTVGTGTWSVNKGTTAQFSSVNSPTATFTPNAGAGDYILTWTIASAGCTSSSSNVTITYNVPSATLSTSNSTQTIVLGNPIGNINYTLSNITSASATGLPPGVTGNLSGSNFTISGTPTTTGIFNYNVMFNTSCGTTITANGSIRVNSNLVTFANIQLPKKDETIPKGSSKSVFAHIIAQGTYGTGQSTSPAITAWIGYTTNATDATNGNFTSGSWVWVPAPYNTGYDSSPSYQITKDEYWVSDFGQTTGYQFSENAGDYYFVSRFQIASETGYIYGGSDGSTANISGGIWNGSNFVARKITVQECATNTWNGSSWSQGTPTIYHKAVIAENYSGNSFEACECEVNSNKTLTIGDGKYVKLKFGLVVNTGGNVIVENDANLIQINNTNNSGSIIVKRNAIMKRLDYTYWGSPVLGQNLRSFSSGTLYTRFYVYNESNDYFDGIFAKNLYPNGNQSLTPLENSATYNYVPGKGYAVRAPNNYTTSVATFNGAFVGVPNNGEITFNLQHTKQGFNLVSNPYPSNIDFDALYSANQTKIYQTAYFWTNVNPNPIMQGSNYPSQYKGVDYYNNYAVYNGSGGVAATSTTGAAGVGSATPNQYIKIGQGFIIKAKPEGNNESLIFKNNVRTENTTGHFFNARKANAKPDRFWLTLSTPLGVNNDLLIAYKENATNDFELDYDAPLLTSPPDSFYSVLGDQKLMIQGRKYPLVIDDKVILGQRFYQDGIYKIAIKAKEGIFASGQNIYLKDKLNGTFTNLQTTDYTFNATQGESTDRFEIVYQPEGALGTSENIKYGLRVYQSGEYYVIEADKAFKEVKVYDASGRLLSTIKSGKKQLMIEKNKLVDGFNLFSIIFADDIVNKKVISK